MRDVFRASDDVCDLLKITVFFLGPTHSSSRFSKALPKIRTLSVKWQRGSLSNIIKVHFTPLHTKRWVLYLDRDTFIVLNSAFYKQVQTCLKNILLIWKQVQACGGSPAAVTAAMWRRHQPSREQSNIFGWWNKFKNCSKAFWQHFS